MEPILSDPQKIKETLNHLKIKPKDYWGQHFLLDETVVKKMVARAQLKPGAAILEIGPGLGILTKELLTTNQRIIAVERDPHLARYLVHNLAHGNLRIINADILKIGRKISSLRIKNYIIVANLPYQISARFLRIFLAETDLKPKQMILMLQKEVADKLTAPVGSLTKLGILAQTYSSAKVLFPVPPGSFYPAPKVYSAVVNLILKQKLPFVCPQDEQLFWRLVRIGFSAKRKKLINNLSSGLCLSPFKAKKMLRLANIDENIRAQRLTPSDWLKMVDIYKEIY